MSESLIAACLYGLIAAGHIASYTPKLELGAEGATGATRTGDKQNPPWVSKLDFFGRVCLSDSDHTRIIVTDSLTV